MNLDTVKIGFIGFGNMASAMADGWIASGAVLAENMCACAGRFDALKSRCEERGMHAIASGAVLAENMCACAGRFDALKSRCEERGMHAFEDAAAVIEAVDVVIVAVKPYMIERVLGPVAQLLADKVVLSVAAGWDCEAYERVIPGTRHLSTVPNTPVAINEGVIACEKASTLTEGRSSSQTRWCFRSRLVGTARRMSASFRGRVISRRCPIPRSPSTMA